jgi:hypothetical protein
MVANSPVIQPGNEGMVRSLHPRSELVGVISWSCGCVLIGPLALMPPASTAH